MIRQKYKIDIDTARLFSSDSRPLATAIDLYARDEMILCLSTVYRAGTTSETPYDLTGNTFRFGLQKAESLHETPLLAFSDVDKVNVALDWDEADLAAGKLSIRVNLNTAQIIALFATASAAIACVGELEAMADGKATTVVQFAARLRPDVIRADPGEPDVGDPEYVTAPVLETYLGNGAGTVNIDANGILRVWDRGTETYRRVELLDGALIPVEDE